MTPTKPTLEDALKNQTLNRIPTAKHIGQHDNLNFVECPFCFDRMPEGRYPQHYKTNHE